MVVRFSDGNGSGWFVGRPFNKTVRHSLNGFLAQIEFACGRGVITLEGSPVEFGFVLDPVEKSLSGCLCYLRGQGKGEIADPLFCDDPVVLNHFLAIAGFLGMVSMRRSRSCDKSVTCYPGASIRGIRRWCTPWYYTTSQPGGSGKIPTQTPILDASMRFRARRGQNARLLVCGLLRRFVAACDNGLPFQIPL